MATSNIDPLDTQEDLQAWNPTPEEINRRSLIYNRLYTCRVLKNQSNPYFSEMSYVSMVDQSVKNAVSYAPSPAESDWRMRINMPETEDKLQTMISFVAANRLRSEVYARDKNNMPNKMLSRAITGINDYVEDVNDSDMLTVLSAQELLTKGTVFINESYEFKEREVTMPDKVDFKSGKVTGPKKMIIDSDKPTKRVVPTEAMFIPNWYQIDIQKQPYIMEVEVLSYDDAKSYYGHYPNWACVPRVNQVMNDTQRLFYFYRRWAQNIADHEVEVIHYYDRNADVYNIVANGILINDVNNPIMFEHKDYPYSYSVYQRYASNFFYGKPFPMRLFNRQEFLNALMMLAGDRGFLSVMPWFITSMQDGIALDDIGPLQRVTVPDVDQFREANIKSIQQGDVSLIEMQRDSIDRSAPDPFAATQNSSATATAIMQAQQSAVQTNSMLLRFMMWLEYHAMKQRISNILQFYAVPDEEKTPGNLIKKVPREIRLKDQQLSNGEMGELVIRIVPSKKQFLTDEEKSAMESSREPGSAPVEYIEVTTDELRNISYEVVIIPDSSVAESKPLRKAQFNEAMGQWFTYFGQSSDQSVIDYWKQKFAEENDLDINKLKPETPQMPEQPGAPQATMPNGATPPPNGAITQQILGNPEQSLSQMVGAPQQ